ncbi:MAG: NAD-dependent epimerase/dehydratase family protein [Burkholderiales bacterium]|nr:NAD-dependent epimerase/dehydratase family protein [Burkholderiales bacterium]
MKKAQNILIAGFGDIGKRVAFKLRQCQHFQIEALIRKSSTVARHPEVAGVTGVHLLKGDLGNPRSLQKIHGRADTVLHFAPPPGTGKFDTFTKNLLRALAGSSRIAHRATHQCLHSRLSMLPRRIVYISTTGVYGNCDGEVIDETRPVKPESARAKRRVDAEKQLRKWGRSYDVAITILRAPGIYAKDRLPLDRLKRQTPVLTPADDVFTNHIHADDLAAAVVMAIRQRQPKRYRVFNIVDDSQLKMGDYFDQVADAFGLARPPRIRREDAELRIAPALLSFMGESRRIGNARAKRELKLELNYPTVGDTLPAMQAGMENLRG